MTKRKSFRQKSSSLSTAVIFILLVSAVIIVTLFIRFVVTVQNSVFDGQHQFVLLLYSSNQQSLLTVFTPEKNEITIIPVTASSSANIGQELHVGIDGKVTTLFPLHLNQPLGNTLLETMFQPQDSQTKVTWYDLLRFYFLTKTSSITTTNLVHVPKDTLSDTIVSNNLPDPDIEKENITIQILNGTSQAGLGRRLEEMLANVGCNIIDVRTSPVDLGLSQIRYYGKISHTVLRLQQILHYPIQQESQRNISDIQIIVGKDNEQTTLF